MQGHFDCTVLEQITSYFNMIFGDMFLDAMSEDFLRQVEHFFWIGEIVRKRFIDSYKHSKHISP